MILMASDSPHLSVSLIASGFDLLREHEIVLGRVRDGGYYLIGQRGFHDVLSSVAMSTASAADDVVARSHEQGLAVAELPMTFDIDEPTDLDELIATLQADPALCPATWQALHQLGIANDRANP
jgi:glycosyltransferase A (GT-A) superfamily protein (DUF2064 family)